MDNAHEYRYNLAGKGFDIRPEQLAHDLTMLILEKSLESNDCNDIETILNKYLNVLHDVVPNVESRTRYDETLSTEN